MIPFRPKCPFPFCPQHTTGIFLVISKLPPQIWIHCYALMTYTNSTTDSQLPNMVCDIIRIRNLNSLLTNQLGKVSYLRETYVLHRRRLQYYVNMCVYGVASRWRYCSWLCLRYIAIEKDTVSRDMKAWSIKEEWATDRERWKSLCKTRYPAQGDGGER